MNILSCSNGKNVLPLCINLERSKTRRYHVETNAAKLQFPINFIRAFDKNLMIDCETNQSIKTEQVLCGASDMVQGVTKPTILKLDDPVYGNKQYTYLPPNDVCKNYKPYVNFLYLGAIGCALSHLECFRIFFEQSDADFLLVLEDDICILHTAKKAIDSVVQYPFDICLIGTSPQVKPKENSDSDLKSSLVYETFPHWYSGSSAYLISRKFVSIFSPFKIVSCASDEFFGFCQMDLGAKILAMHEPCFGLSEHAQVSTNTTGNI